MKKFKQFLDEILQQQPRSQLGSNPGGIYSDTDTGEKFYIKHYENPDQAKVETLTGKIYKHMGINTIDPEMHEGTAVKTKWNEHLGYADPRKDLMNPGKKQADQLARMYHGAVLTKNWDIVGLGYDNIMKHKNGNLYAVDHGGAFHFRAQGDHKEYTPDVNEKHSLVHNDNPSGRVFSELHANHPDAIKRSLETVKNMDMNHIHHLFKTSGLDNWQDLHDNFVKRRENLIGSYNMKTFKQFTSEQKDISQPLIGFCSAGGPPNQRSILEAVRTRRISDSGTVLTDPAADNTGLGHPDNHYSKIVSKPADSDDERPDVEPHLTNQQAHHFRALANITQHNHPDYRLIVPNYTNGSTDLNEHLYNRYKQGKPHDPVVQGINVASLDHLIGMHKTPHAMTVYTGPYFNPADHAGKETTLPAFTSTSLTPHVAKDFGKWDDKIFANKDPESHRHVLRIHLPEGHPHLFASNRSVYQGQGELILPRQTKIQIAEKPSHIVRGNFNEHFTDTPDFYNHIVHFWDAHIVH